MLFIHSLYLVLWTVPLHQGVTEIVAAEKKGEIVS